MWVEYQNIIVKFTAAIESTQVSLLFENAVKKYWLGAL